MKKMFFFPVLLMLLLVVPVFAQDEEKSGWTVSGGAQVFADLMYFTKGSGKTTTTVSGIDDTEFGKELGGSFNVMSSSNSYAPGIQTDLVIANSKEGDKFSYALSLQMIFGLQRGKGLLSKDYDKVSFVDFLDSFKVGDWFVKGTAGMFEGYLGNTGYGGVVSVSSFNDFINFKPDFFYVNVLGDRKDTNSMKLGSGGSVFALGVNFLDDKLRFALGTDIGDSMTGYDAPYASANSVNMAAIFSINNLADLLSLDLFYGIKGNDANSNFFNAASWDNRFGVYAGLGISDTVGITVGYSAFVKVTEKYNKYDYIDKEWTSFKYKNPLFSTIHLNLDLEINKFGITFNNNISFAGKKGKEYKAGDDVILGLNGIAMGDDKYSQSWFGWDTGLALNFKATDALNLCLQLTNQLGIFGEKYDGDKLSNIGNIFFVGLNAEYKIGMVTFGAGLNVEAVSATVKYKGDETTKGKDSEVRFGIPLFFKVEF